MCKCQSCKIILNSAFNFDTCQMSEPAWCSRVMIVYINFVSRSPYLYLLYLHTLDTMTASTTSILSLSYRHSYYNHQVYWERVVWRWRLLWLSNSKICNEWRNEEIWHVFLVRLETEDNFYLLFRLHWKYFLFIEYFEKQHFQYLNKRTNCYT